MDILCSGMYRSCSTWQYNVASELVERHGGIRLGFVDGRDYQPFPEDRDWQLRVLKTHDRHDIFATALRTDRALALYSVRDLRDVAFSIMHKFHISFDEVIALGGLLETCLLNDFFWTSLPNVLVQRYELITEDPISAVRAIAQFIGKDIETAAAGSLATEYSLDRNRVRTDSLAQQLRNAGVDLEDPKNQLRYDPKTLLHWNHLRSGSNGAWREHATPEQKAALAQVCGEWLIQRGYEASLSWVESGFRSDGFADQVGLGGCPPMLPGPPHQKRRSGTNGESGVRKESELLRYVFASFNAIYGLFSHRN